MKRYFELRITLRDCEASPGSRIDVVDHGRTGAQERLATKFVQNPAKTTLGKGGFGVVKGYGDDAARGYVVKKVALMRGDDEAAITTMARELVSLMFVNGWREFTFFLKPFANPIPGCAYIFMPVVHGTNMDQWFASLERRPVPEADRLKSRALINVYRQIRDIHRKGLVHLDIKSANVMVDANGMPEVIDFGIVERFGEYPQGYSRHWSPLVFDAAAFRKSVPDLCAHLSVNDRGGLEPAVEQYVENLCNYARNYAQLFELGEDVRRAIAPQYDLFAFCLLLLRARLAKTTLLPIAAALSKMLDLSGNPPFAQVLVPGDVDAAMRDFAMATGFDERRDATTKTFDVFRRASLAAVTEVSHAGKPRQLADGAFFLSRELNATVARIDRRVEQRHAHKEALDSKRGELEEAAAELEVLEKRALEHDLTADVVEVTSHVASMRDAEAFRRLFARLDFFNPAALDVTALFARDGTPKRKLEKEDLLTLYVQQLTLVRSYDELKRALTRIFALAYVNRGFWTKEQTKTASTIYAAFTNPENARARKALEQPELFGAGFLSSPAAFRKQTLALAAGAQVSNPLKEATLVEDYLKRLNGVIDDLNGTKQRERMKELLDYAGLLRLIEDRKLSMEAKRAVAERLEYLLSQGELKANPMEAVRRAQALATIATLDAGGAVAEKIIQRALPHAKPLEADAGPLDAKLLEMIGQAIGDRLRELSESVKPERRSTIVNQPSELRPQSVVRGADDEATVNARRPDETMFGPTRPARRPN